MFARCASTIYHYTQHYNCQVNITDISGTSFRFVYINRHSGAQTISASGIFFGRDH